MQQNTKFGISSKKKLILCDLSNSSIELTAWKETADYLEQITNEEVPHVLALKFAVFKKDEKFGLSLSINTDTRIIVLSKEPGAHRNILNALIQKYSNGNEQVENLSNN